mmetsp:Transcript_28369/g.69028  ORF Transcript_28369/g.69028 Transcript_28369/m.69028 type:complete len:87 (+) Transcript_28369:1142-1402(+)
MFDVVESCVCSIFELRMFVTVAPPSSSNNSSEDCMCLEIFFTKSCRHIFINTIRGLSELNCSPRRRRNCRSEHNKEEEEHHKTNEL